MLQKKTVSEIREIFYSQGNNQCHVTVYVVKGVKSKFIILSKVLLSSSNAELVLSFVPHSQIGEWLILGSFLLCFFFFSPFSALISHNVVFKHLLSHIAFHDSFLNSNQ